MAFEFECDCACHPSVGLVAEQRIWEFGTMILGGSEVPVFCCFCHYPAKVESADVQANV